MKGDEENRYGLDLHRLLAILLGMGFHAPIIYYIPEMTDEFSGFGKNQNVIPEIEL